MVVNTIFLRDIGRILGAKTISGEDMLDIKISSGFGCDLISDSLKFSKPDCLLITGLTNVQIIRVAEMIEAKAILFVRGKQPGPEIIKLAAEKKLPLLTTDRFLFESCGLLYQHGLRSY